MGDSEKVDDWDTFSCVRRGEEVAGGGTGLNAKSGDLVSGDNAEPGVSGEDTTRPHAQSQTRSLKDDARWGTSAVGVVDWEEDEMFVFLAQCGVVSHKQARWSQLSTRCIL